MSGRLLKRTPMIDPKPGAAPTVAEFRREIVAALRSAKSQVRALQGILARLPKGDEEKSVPVRQASVIESAPQRIE